MRRTSRALPAITLLLASFECLAAAPGARLALKVTRNGYLEAPGVSIMLYSDNYSPIFFDQKDAAMQIILHGRRIATNGSVRLSPTPQQWDPIPHLITHAADEARDRLTASVAYPAYHLRYHVVVTAEPGGVRVSVNLDRPLPQTLVGRAGFNLEFLPSLYMDKPYAVDDKVFGVLPRSPEDRMTTVPPRAGDPKSLWYVHQWHAANGYTQPLPFATGKSITLAVNDRLDRISVTSRTGPLLLYDGRDLAQNGWYVLRTLIPAGKTRDAVVWHIRPSYIPHWMRPPMIAHSQVGYAAAFRKVAVIELDRRFKAPRTAALLRLSDHGTYRRVFTGPVSAPTRWLRYDYVKFDFSSVRKPGLYVIQYAGRRSSVFPIAADVYGNTWQTTLDEFLAEQMDHVSVRDAYHMWHGIAHMTDALQAPPNITHFDGYWMGASTESPYKPGQHIPGLNVGGWFDAGDFDNDAFGQYGTIQNLALTYETFHPRWDELSVDEKARSVVMHRPDGVPDIVEQVEHGVLQTLAQIDAVGHPFTGIQSPYLSAYTFIGDAASQTGIYSNNPYPRWAWTMTSPNMEYAAAASLASASRVLKGWNDPLSRKCLEAAVKMWRLARNHPLHRHLPGYLEGAGGYREFGLGSPQWTAAVELTIATHGAQPYRKRLEAMFPTTGKQIAFGGWAAVRALPYLSAGYRTRLKAAVEAFVPQLNRYLAATPFGVPPSLGAWGGSAQVAQFGAEMYFLHQAFPDIVGPQYTLRAANYLLGTHPVSSVSYISAIGTRSKLQAYGNNRYDDSFIPGGMIPGYIIIKPDFPECITRFGFLWYEDEYTIDAAATWVLEANAANAIVKQEAMAARRGT
ncbi:MAG TPA: glycoside hydrolase family 9 protein [Steroidobacteraceae bacterium]|nr:glycoside hydrolase family 9 protein [Steroidobacteraceae bacterium]